MFEHLLKIRYVTVVIVILAVLHALAFLLMGAQSSIEAYKRVLGKTDAHDYAQPGIELLHSLDYLFVSMVLVILALGVAKLFLMDPAKERAGMPAWLGIQSIAELKVLLWETILTTLLILGLSDLSAGIFEKPAWTVLVTPVAILILSLSLFFMKKV
jgi:uncharacterized membrane protein YqhA